MNPSLQILEFHRSDKIIPSAFALAKSSPSEDLTVRSPEISLFEWERALQFQHERARHSFLLGRRCAKKALQLLDPSLDLSKISLTSALPGHPLFTGVLDPYEVSISHSLDFALSVISPATHPVTIDLERIRPERIEAIHRMLTDHEKQMIEITPDPHSTATLIWTAKEALSKWLRSGMSIDFQILEIQSLQQESDRITGTFEHLFHLRFESWSIGDWWLTMVFPNKSRFHGFTPRTLDLLQ